MAMFSERKILEFPIGNWRLMLERLEIDDVGDCVVISLKWNINELPTYQEIVPIKEWYRAFRKLDL